MALRVKIPMTLFSDVTMLMEKVVLSWAEDISRSPGSTLLGDVRHGVHLQCGDAAAPMEIRLPQLLACPGTLNLW